MLISTKGRYALRVMIDLAEHRSGEFISLKEIAQRQEISEKYLESIIRTLVKAKVVESLRGKGAGKLLRPVCRIRECRIHYLRDGLRHVGRNGYGQHVYPLRKADESGRT